LLSSCFSLQRIASARLADYLPLTEFRISIFAPTNNNINARKCITSNGQGGTATDVKDVPWKAPAPMRVNSEFVSNKSDESDMQYEQRSEQRI
jgi:hypothetical protein